MNNNQIAVKFENVEIAYGKNTIIKNLDLEILQGKFTMIMGLSGSGKTTIIRSINGLNEISKGRIKVNETDISKISKFKKATNVSYVVQKNGLFEHMSILSNLMLARKSHFNRIKLNFKEVLEKGQKNKKQYKKKLISDRKKYFEQQKKYAKKQLKDKKITEKEYKHKVLSSLKEFITANKNDKKDQSKNKKMLKQEFKRKIKHEKTKGIFSKEKFTKRIEIMFKDLSLKKELLKKRPSELSGGQNQRVEIARAFLLDTKIILLDEPFSALDPIVRRSIQNITYNLMKKYNKTIIMVSHDPEEVVRLSDEIVIIKDKGLYKKRTWTIKEIKRSRDKWIRKLFLFDTSDDKKEMEGE